MPEHQPQPCPPWQVSRWFNTEHALSLSSLRGRVVVVEAFQMLCPGCVQHGLPQVQKLQRLFPPDEVALVGLHTVFEHHEVMTPAALEVFIHEYRLDFPIGVDEPGQDGPMPRTMAAWELGGTPSLVLIDRQGRMRMRHLGSLEDMALGAAVAQLMLEPAAE